MYLNTTLTVALKNRIIIYTSPGNMKYIPLGGKITL